MFLSKCTGMLLSTIIPVDIDVAFFRSNFLMLTLDIDLELVRF